jgi:hypothetical protein
MTSKIDNSQSLWSDLDENQSESINGGFRSFASLVNVNVNIATISVVQTNVAAIVARVGGNINLNQYNNSANSTSILA